MRFSWRRCFLVGVVVTVLIVIAIIRVRRPEEVRLKDGSVLAIRDVKLGKTNTFKHGTWLDKTIGAHVGTNIRGLKVFSVTIKRPEIVGQYYRGESSFSVELQLAGTNSAGNELSRPSFYRSYSGFLFVFEADPGRSVVAGIRAAPHPTIDPRIDLLL
jgi:hypothetical protein